MKQVNEHHTFTGMQRDLDVLRHPANFLYNARNIRLTPRDGDTLFAITNERGTIPTHIVLPGKYLGHCFLNQYLVVFSKEFNTVTDEEGNNKEVFVNDHISRINLEDNTIDPLYKGNLGFSMSNPIEATGSYENLTIQKVYWTDGINQPRVINIVGSILEGVDSQFDFVRNLQLKEKVNIQKQLGAAGTFAPGVIQYAFTYFSKYGQESNIFYTSPLLYVSYKDRGGSPEDKVENAFKITISNLDNNFDYVRIYSIQRTSVNGTPIVKRVQDIGIKDLAVNTESKEFSTSDTTPSALIDNKYVNLRFNHELYKRKSLLGSSSSVDWYGYTKASFPNLVIKTNKGYVTWGSDSTDNSVIWVSQTRFTATNNSYGYQICETPDSSSEYIESVTLSLTDELYDKVSFLDTGTTGDSIDPTELLYKGGETIVAGTLEQKDNTLFFGNISLTRPQITKELKTIIENSTSISQDTRIFYPIKITSGSYGYSNQLTSFTSNAQDKRSVPCGGFKRGDYYRCGVQFQHESGKWSDPIFIKDVQITNKPSSDNSSVTIPTLKGTLSSDVVEILKNKGYKKSRAVVVFPDIQDRVTVCQGVACPTLYTKNHRNTDKDLYAQSSWFFRPKVYSKYINEDGTASPVSEGYIAYTYRGTDYNENEGDYPYDPSNIRQVEIQGSFKEDNQFQVSNDIFTLHSPDIEFDDHIYSLDLFDMSSRLVGEVSFTSTMSDIDIQTESATVSTIGGGFEHKSFTSSYSHGIIAGLFYDDFSLDDAGTNIEGLQYQRSTFKWLVYPWHRTGSLNNDVSRPADKGVRTAMLKKKVISNLRYADTFFFDNIDNKERANAFDDTPQIFSSDQLAIVKIGDKIYQGNIDTAVSPDNNEGVYFAFGKEASTGDQGSVAASIRKSDITTEFTSNSWWKTFSASEISPENEGLWKRIYRDGRWIWTSINNAAGEKYLGLLINKDIVRIKYKSTPHLVFNYSYSVTPSNEHQSVLPVIEIIRKGDNIDPNNSFYRSTMFGGSLEDAKKANIWIPCGEPVLLEESNEYKYEYGDTYYQRWDCLKTYPFTLEDINQIVEIGSFMLETRINIEGRYDRNRGQINNLNMTPQNFNLLNPVYSQINNFFTYRILDEAYYTIDSFPNQITWTKEKQAGADVDAWTNITLTSTYDMDGSKGSVVSLKTYKDLIYCFQDKGVSNILFNSRVQIPTSDGVPIEISNSYKVDGYRYISDGVGCSNKALIKKTPSGIYFIDSVSNDLYHIGDNIQDVSATHNMTSWFKNSNNTIDRILYDDVNHDIYLVNKDESLCFSETLGQFTSFMDYDGISLIESYNNKVFTVHEEELRQMFEGPYNDFFPQYQRIKNRYVTIHDYKPWEITFVSNGSDSGAQDLDKIFNNLDYRMTAYSDDLGYMPDNTLSSIQVTNESQDTGEVPLTRLKVINNPKSYNNKEANLQKKFKICRIEIPRNHNSLDRIRNTWCKITLKSNNEDSIKTILHDLNVQYYV